MSEKKERSAATNIGEMGFVFNPERIGEFMTKQSLHPGLGSGALREALRVAHLYILRNDRWSEPVLCRACLKSAILAKDIPHAEGCLYVRIEALLSLSSPIEPRERELESLIVHMWVHSGYTKNGYQQMTTPQKALYDSLVGRSEDIAERDMPQTAVMRERAQASSEIREAKLRELQARLDENIIADTRVCNGQDLQMHRKRKEWLKAQIEAEVAALAPSRQGAGGK